MMTEPPVPRRGDLWLADLDKRRPVVVLTRDPLGQFLQSVIVAPVTTTVRGLSTEVGLGPEDGIDTISVANLDNLSLLDRGRLVRRVGSLTSARMGEICDAAAIALGCG